VEASVAQWFVAIVAPGVAAGVAAHLWISSPLRAHGKERWLLVACVAFLLLGSSLSPSPSAWSSWTWLARVAATAWLTVAAGAVPRLVRRRREPPVVRPGSSPYRTGRRIDAPSLRAYSEERVTFRLALALTVLAGVGGLASAPSNPGWHPWHEPVAATR
jgi:hypothetical protein